MGSVIRVVCFKWGDKYGPEYVARLKSMFARHLSLPHMFTCYTERPVEGVDCLPLPTEYGSWWCKLGAFKPGVVTGPAILCDLDMVFVGSLDWVADYLDCDLACIENWGSKLHQGPLYEDEISSAFMVWNGNGATDAIWNQFEGERTIKRLHPHGDQTFITEVMRGKLTLIPQERIASYKRHCRDAGGPPKAASVVAFHGFPRNHEVDDKWVKDAWQ